MHFIAFLSLLLAFSLLHPPPPLQLSAANAGSSTTVHLSFNPDPRFRVWHFIAAVIFLSCRGAPLPSRPVYLRPAHLSLAPQHCWCRVFWDLVLGRAWIAIVVDLDGTHTRGQVGSEAIIVGGGGRGVGMPVSLGQVDGRRFGVEALSRSMRGIRRRKKTIVDREGGAWWTVWHQEKMDRLLLRWFLLLVCDCANCAHSKTIAVAAAENPPPSCRYLPGGGGSPNAVEG